MGIVGFLCKTVTWMLNYFLMAEVQFHNTLHGLHTGRVTRTAPLEAKLLQQLMFMREEVL